MRCGNIGPCSYEPRDNSLSNFPRASSPKMSPELIVRDDKNFVSFAPPVGTYNIPRDLSPSPVSHVDASSNRNLTSSFRTSGREKPLMGCGNIYMTLREDLKNSNRGPGMYLNITPSVSGRVCYSPSFSDSRHRANLVSSPITDVGSGRQSQRNRYNDTPCSTPLPTPSKKMSSLRNSESFCSVSPSELKRNIEQVRNLPDYPR